MEEKLPLFASQEARERAELGASRAAQKAERLEPGWKMSALAVVLDHAKAHAEPFLAETLRSRITIPSDADPRAIGNVFSEAARLGFIKTVGFAPANSSNGSPKCVWQSLVFRKKESA